MEEGVRHSQGRGGRHKKYWGGSFGWGKAKLEKEKMDWEGVRKSLGGSVLSLRQARRRRRYSVRGKDAGGGGGVFVLGFVSSGHVVTAGRRPNRKRGSFNGKRGRVVLVGEKKN